MRRSNFLVIAFGVNKTNHSFSLYTISFKKSIFYYLLQHVYKGSWNNRMCPVCVSVPSKNVWLKMFGLWKSSLICQGFYRPLTEVYPLHRGYPCWWWPRFSYGTNSPKITLLDHQNFIRVHKIPDLQIYYRV